MVLGGYLHKKTRGGQWQRRYFETNGAYLTYYKSKKMEKLLAALILPQVGEIKEVPDEGEDVGMFSLELNNRIYILKGKNSEEAKLWVSTLIRLRDEGLSIESGWKPHNLLTSRVRNHRRVGRQQIVRPGLGFELICLRDSSLQVGRGLV